MVTRLAACDPCRTSKLACDHGQPVCTRCRKSNRDSECTYRQKPFVRRRSRALGAQTAPPTQSSGSSTPKANTSVSLLYTTPNIEPSEGRHGQYPNPGFLGESSHATIFNRFAASRSQGVSNSGTLNSRQGLQSSPELINNGVAIIESIRAFADMPKLFDLVDLWLSKDLNLPLAGPLIPRAVKTTLAYWRKLESESGISDEQCSRDLLRNSSAPLSAVCPSLTEYCSQFCEEQIRWETLGLFFVAVSQATAGLVDFLALYKTDGERRAICERAVSITDRCLELSLALDCLNDLQFFLQFENWVVYSRVEGDQSYRAWRRLGDVASSLLALGYHEKPSSLSILPPYMAELRRTAFAQVYATDKNVSIFLGRAPRVCRRFCHFELPSGTMESQSTIPTGPTPDPLAWNPLVKVSYVAEIRWSALCAILKEDTLELFRDQNRDNLPERISSILIRADQFWQALPAHFRLETSLRDFSGTSFERGFLASTRLNYLHVQFLLHMVTLDRTAEPDAALLDVAQQMLSLVVEVIILRTRLANSGTGLTWKVAYYGLPAAGILCLSFLRQQTTPTRNKVISSRVLRDLSVLVTAVELGAVVEPEHANYALLSQAVATIQTMLDMILAGTLSTEQVPQTAALQPQVSQDVSVYTLPETQWAPWNNADPWEFELDFWNNITDHLSFLGEQG